MYVSIQYTNLYTKLNIIYLPGLPSRHIYCSLSILKSSQVSCHPDLWLWKTENSKQHLPSQVSPARMDAALILLAGPLLRTCCNTLMVDQWRRTVEASIVIDVQHATFGFGVTPTWPKKISTASHWSAGCFKVSFQQKNWFWDSHTQKSWRKNHQHPND